MYIADDPIIEEWNFEKNTPLGFDPKKIRCGSDKKVWWRCAKGHEWDAVIYNRTNGNGCPVCSGRLLVTGVNDLATMAPKLAAEWHPTKNGDLTSQMVTAHSIKKVWWLCSICGYEWEGKINARWRLHFGCPACSGRRLVPGNNDLATVCPTLVQEWHPTKNGDLTPQMLTSCCNKRVWWLCRKCGHEWEAQVCNRSNGCGCPICARKRKVYIKYGKRDRRLREQQML